MCRQSTERDHGGAELGDVGELGELRPVMQREHRQRILTGCPGWRPHGDRNRPAKAGSAHREADSVTLCGGRREPRRCLISGELEDRMIAEGGRHSSWIGRIADHGLGAIVMVDEEQILEPQHRGAPERRLPAVIHSNEPWRVDVVFQIQPDPNLGVASRWIRETKSHPGWNHLGDEVLRDRRWLTPGSHRRTLPSPWRTEALNASQNAARRSFMEMVRARYGR